MVRLNPEARKEVSMDVRADAGALPITAYAVLGLLTFGEMSGYDLKRMANQSIRYFYCSPASSQIYGELRRLTSLGYATERKVAQERRPDKRLYQITPEGQRVLQRWLERPEVEPDVLKSTFLLKLFFGSLTPQETLMAQIEERRRQAQETLAQFEAIEEHVKGDEKFYYPYLTLRSGMANFRARLQWTEEVLKELKEKRWDTPSGA